MLSSRKPYFDKDETILSFPWKSLSFWEFSSLLFSREFIMKFKLLCSFAEKINFKLHLLILHACFFGIHGYPIYQGVNPTIKYFALCSRKHYFDKDETILSFPWKKLSFWEFSSLLFSRELIMKFKLLCSVAARMNFITYLLLFHCFLFGIYGYPIHQGFKSWIKSLVPSSRKP